MTVIAGAPAASPGLTPPPATGRPTLADHQARATPYAFWALTLLVIANFFNYVDRHIVTIIATSIQRDIKMTDAQLGFLMGTAFATLYGMVGISMGRIADSVSRTKLLAAGLAIWSTMTALSGMAFSFVSLALARVGVGIGEAIATPCSHPLLSDYFPARNRSMVLACYLVGAPLGIAASMALGGALIGKWADICPVLPGNACAISDWQAAFFVVGVPGLVLALAVARLYEPAPRAVTQPVPRIIARELSSAIPPFTFFSIFAEGGIRALMVNIMIAGGLILAAIVIALLTGDWAQWIAIALGTYSIMTWGQVLRMRDRPLYRLTFGSSTTWAFLLGGAVTGTMGVTVSSWAAPYAIRVLQAPPVQLGLYLGASSLVSSIFAALVGGYITDKWKQRDPRAPIWMALISLIGPIIPLMLMLRAETLPAFAACYTVFTMFAMAWMGGYAALIQDSVLPRMRGTATAIFALVVTLVSAGIGPYMVGKISAVTGSLAMGLMGLLALIPLGLFFLIMAAIRLRRETPEIRRAWAIEAGEPADALPRPM